MNKIRVRFAPSPTGYLHIGGARTALFNWLFAKKNGGAFILRIEDTDEARSTDESIRAIIESMQWLGLNWDEGPKIEDRGQRTEVRGQGTEVRGQRTEVRGQKTGDREKTHPPPLISQLSSLNSHLSPLTSHPSTLNSQLGSYGPYFQMERLDIYKKYAKQLISNGKAYYCYCTPEELKTMREEQQSKKLPPKYDGRCRNRGVRTDGGGQNAVIRFKMPREGKIAFDDIVRGHLEFENTLLDDFVILKASGVPTYNFACTIDDKLMEISHVIRGDDHLSNTPRQIHLYNALNWELPQFAHLSMILGPDGSRLSKRHGHTSVLEYKNDGYLNVALINYLALLGWSTSDSQQIFELDELLNKFSLEKCSKSPAIFDIQKLQWLNMEYLKKLSAEEIYKKSIPFITNAALPMDNPGLIIKILRTEKEKIKLLSDVPNIIDFFVLNDVKYESSALEKVLKDENADKILRDLLPIFENCNDFSKVLLEKSVRNFCELNGIKTSRAFHPVRVAVSGRMYGPGLFDLLELLGKQKVVERIAKFLSEYLEYGEEDKS